MRTLRAELLKLRTTRTSRAFLLAAVALAAAGVAEGVAVAGNGSAPPLSAPEPQAALLGAGRLAGLLAAFLGSIAMSGEYRHGTIAPTLLATPRRGRVVAAAALANLLAGAALGLAAALTAALGTAAVLAATGTGLTVAAADAAAAAVGTVAWAALAALLGFGAGAVARNQPLAVALVAVLLLALDQALAPALPELARWLPRRLGAALASGRLDGDPGAPLAGAVLAVYGLALTVAGWLAVRNTEAR
jgi:ABC-type transport system involved in multi-copper enzyme maturation permease subunit